LPMSGQPFRRPFAHRVGNYPAAARLLGDVRDTIVTIGGSHAQRNLFELLLEDAGDRRA